MLKSLFHAKVHCSVNQTVWHLTKQHENYCGNNNKRFYEIHNCMKSNKRLYVNSFVLINTAMIRF